MDTQTPTPRLPSLFAKPLAFLPQWPALFALERTLNVVFAEPLREGEIDFLEGRMMALKAIDDPDLRIAGDAFAFLQLATRAEDSDTLFFRRQLSTTGDTDLGLYLKNFLDGLDPESLPLNQLTGPLLRLGAGIARRF